MNTPELLEIEKTRCSVIKDTIRLPLTETENDFVHVATTPSKLADVFGTYADKLGYDGTEAKGFFEEKVEAVFGKIRDIPSSCGTRLDDITERVISSIYGRIALGTVVPTKDGKYIFGLDPQAIAQNLPGFKTRSFQIKGYTQQTTEQKIASFQQAVKYAAEHEFFHILQFIENPQAMEKASRRVLLAQRFWLTYAATSMVISTLFPARTNLAIISAGGLATVGVTVYLQRGRAKIEREAHNAQKKSLGLELKNPFTFVHEAS